MAPRVEEADELYGLPLDEFVGARTELARRLRKEGRRDEAAEVSGLRKPTVPAWAVNQLARRRPKDVEALLRAAERVRREPEGAADELRKALDRLVREAGRLLGEGGHSATDATLQRVATTLRAAAASEGEERDALERGTLPAELEPSGFEAMASLAGGGGGRRPARTAKKARRDDGAARRRVAEARDALAEARERARELRRTAADAEREAKRARREAERADAEVEKAERALERARP